MAVEWTDSTRVRARIKSGSSMTNAEIDDLIEQNEGFVKTQLKLDTTFTFSASKKPHLLLRKVAEAMTVLNVIASTPLSFLTLEQAYSEANITRDEIDMINEILEGTGARDFIKNS